MSLLRLWPWSLDAEELPHIDPVEAKGREIQRRCLNSNKNNDADTPRGGR